MTVDVFVGPSTRWPKRCTYCRSTVVTPTKECWQVCDNCDRIWVSPESIEYAVGAGMVPPDCCPEYRVPSRL
jgi:hypothetical protein